MYKIACIPAYNEGKIIKKLVGNISDYVDKVIVCDDGSDDNTYSEAKSAGAVVLKHDQNVGKGVALKTLFDYSKKNNADLVVTIDGDGQFLPEEIPKIMKNVIDGTSDIVIGYRFEDDSEMPKYRKAGNKLLDKMTNLASELPFRDTQSGFRAYSRKAISQIEFNTKGFGVDSEILIDASKKGLKVSEEKITVIYDTGFKTSTSSPIVQSADVITSLLELIAIKHPLKFLGIPGLILITIGIVYSIIVITIFNDTRYFSIPSTLIAVGSIVIGLLSLLMSIVLFAINKGLKKYN